jgi:hypothetical protein
MDRPRTSGTARGRIAAGAGFNALGKSTTNEEVGSSESGFVMFLFGS